MRHKHWVCYKVTSSGNYESSFLDKSVETGSGTTTFEQRQILIGNIHTKP